MHIFFSQDLFLDFFVNTLFAYSFSDLAIVFVIMNKNILCQNIRFDLVNRMDTDQGKMPWSLG